MTPSWNILINKIILSSTYFTASLRTKDCQFENFVVIGGTASNHNDNLWCHQSRQNCQIGDFLFSVILLTSNTHYQGDTINTLRPRQNGRHFADDIFKWIFLNENVWIASKISLKFVPQGPINNIPALVQIMAWRQATRHYLVQWWLDYRRIYASLGLNKLRCSAPNFFEMLFFATTLNIPVSKIGLFNR